MGGAEGAEQVVDQLVQAVPVEGGVPSERTEIWIGFDDARCRSWMISRKFSSPIHSLSDVKPDQSRKAKYHDMMVG
mgnify:CR=1 FL=1